MTGVFLKLSQIIRYFDDGGDSSNLDKLITGEPFYYDKSLFCSAIISRTKDNIKFLCLMDRDEPEPRGNPRAPPNPIEVSGSLNISNTGEFLIDEFKCLDCNANKCMHVAAHLVFMNRHNLNKFEQFKPNEVEEARKLVISARYNATPLEEIFKRRERQHGSGSDSDEEEGSDEEIRGPLLTEEQRRRFLESLCASAPHPNSMIAHIMKGFVENAEQQRANTTDQPSSSMAADGATSKASTSKSTTSNATKNKK